MIIAWKSKPPRVKPGHVRDEQEQARYLEQLIRIYYAENIEGAFVYAFSEPSNSHTANPDTDLDMASYGIVKVLREPDPQPPVMEQWEPKKAFYPVAALYTGKLMSGNGF